MRVLINGDGRGCPAFTFQHHRIAISTTTHKGSSELGFTVPTSLSSAMASRTECSSDTAPRGGDQSDGWASFMLPRRSSIPAADAAPAPRRVGVKSRARSPTTPKACRLLLFPSSIMLTDMVWLDLAATVIS
ncbi:unnamed protein product [Vitrella brassicaformis CCMP3155]|uniref:Uncharacterized protein n=1 Tax=Vitrella brassicaformis (strain CCMP3155) TaxID=1169540 RepID=A0A0G4GQP4_VITBC|nr:unnamed protein product [Vitrella brassicaformis CCMP3155]|eukprot:CEM32769.1 unnamed protein product [Vitrella brassicaformis CCMP3155]